jgi:hypothetical protein
MASEDPDQEIHNAGAGNSFSHPETAVVAWVSVLKWTIWQELTFHITQNPCVLEV